MGEGDFRGEESEERRWERNNEGKRELRREREERRRVTEKMGMGL